MCPLLAYLSADAGLLTLGDSWYCRAPLFAHSTSQEDLEEGCQDCAAWLAECGAVVTGGEGSEGGGEGGAFTAVQAVLDCKASAAGQLKMPEEKDKVAHGDENLKLEDFLARF